MAILRNKVTHLVWKVVYEYDDYELNNHQRFEEYFETYDNVVVYLSDTVGREFQYLDNSFYKCRVNVKIKVCQTSLSDRVYHSLFK